MSTITANTNLNTLQPNKYRVIFDRIPLSTFFCQKATLPGLSINAVEWQTRYNTVKIPGGKIVYDHFTVGFQVDEDLSNWFEIFDWIKRASVFDAASDFTAHELETVYSDATLQFLTNNGNPNKNIRFVDCFPVSLTEVPVDVSSTDGIIVANATFVFNTMKRE
jgi:hypothetical protein